MQTRFRLSTLILITAVIIVSSCSKKTNKEGRYIPNNAAFVFLVNGESLSSKLPWEEIKQNSMFKDIREEYKLDDKTMAVFENPDNTGIDIKKNMLFFVQKDSIGGYIAIEGSIKDAAKFKEFNNTMNKDASETTKDDIHFLNSTKMTTSWDKEKFVIVIDIPQMGQTNRFRSRYDSSYTPTPSVKRNTVNTASGIYALAENNSLAKDEKFSDLVGTKGDIHFWTNTSSIMAGNTDMATLSMMNINKLYEGSYVTGVTNFENGKINVDIRSYAGKELTDIYKKYSGGKLNMEMIKRIPAKDVAALFALNFKPEGLKEFIKLTGLEGIINLGAAQLGFTFDDFIKANKGDILFAVSDIKKDSNGVPTANALFSTSIGDKNAFGKLVEAGKKLEREAFGSSQNKFLSYNQNDNYFIIGTDKTTIDKFLSTPNNSNYDFLDKAAGTSSVFYVNIPVIVKSMSNDLTRDSLDNISFQTTIATWESVIATGGGFENGGLNEHIEFNLTDKNSNSLKQLNKYINTMAGVEAQKKKKRDEWLNALPSEDSTAVPAPVEDKN